MLLCVMAHCAVHSAAVQKKKCKCCRTLPLTSMKGITIHRWISCTKHTYSPKTASCLYACRRRHSRHAGHVTTIAGHKPRTMSAHSQHNSAVNCTVICDCGSRVHPAAVASSCLYLHCLGLMHYVFQWSHLALQVQDLHCNNLVVGEAAGTPHHSTARE